MKNFDDKIKKRKIIDFFYITSQQTWCERYIKKAGDLIFVGDDKLIKNRKHS